MGEEETEMETMVKYEAKQPTEYERFEVAGADVLDRGDIVVPRIRLRQPTSKFGTPQDAGKFHNNLTEGFSETIDAVVLRVSKGRVMWPEAFSGDNEPECASDDGIVPRVGNGLSNRQPGPCATCPFSQWSPDGTPPRCSLVYTYRCADRGNDDMPFLISAMRTSAKAAKKLNSLIKLFGIRKSVRIAAELVNGDQGQWYELKFEAGESLSPDEVRRYADMARSLAAVDMAVDTEPVDEPGGDDPLF